MSARNVLELAQQWASVGNRRARFLDVYPYVEMLRGCHIEPSYLPQHDLAAAFEFTPAGEEVCDYIATTLPDVDPDARRLGVAVSFSQDEVYVEVEGIDIPRLHKALNVEIMNGAIRFPQEYGRVMYDRFFELFPSTTDALTYEQTQVLVEDLPNASYQVGALTVGPLGAAKAASFRIFPPSHSAPLWHCSDTGCSALHTVRLGIAPSSMSRVSNAISARNRELRIARSEWGKLLRNLSGEYRDFYGDSSMPQLPYLLADAFTGDELRLILRTALELSPQAARDTLSSVIEVRRSSDEITNDASEHAALQCLLILDERLVGTAIEAAVLTDRVSVPITERRQAVAFKLGGSWWDLRPEVGALGLRSVSPTRYFPLLRLQKLLMHVGAASSGTGALDWELRFAPGTSLIEKLAHKMQEEEPQALLRRFVLASAESLQTSIDYLQPMFFEMPQSEEEETLLLDRILWKLGFTVAQYPPELSTFWRRSAAMEKVVPNRSGRVLAAEEDSIRSAAVNYFISLEDLLDRTMAFTGWALLHDHFAVANDKQFSFDLQDSRRFVAARLIAAGSTEPLNPNGHNTLSPLICNLSFLSDHLGMLASDPSTQDPRDDADLPGFYDSGAAPFPFLHKTPLHDLNPDAVIRIIGVLRAVATDLARIDVPNLRNRLEHKRPDEDFPTANEINAGITVVGNCVTALEIDGLIPVLHVFESENRDQYGRTQTVLRDYAGRATKIAGPTGSRYGQMPSLTVPQVPLNAARLRNIPDILRFTLSEESPFRSKWKNYPRRRLRLGDLEEVLAAKANV